MTAGTSGIARSALRFSIALFLAIDLDAPRLAIDSDGGGLRERGLALDEAPPAVCSEGSDCMGCLDITEFTSLMISLVRLRLPQPRWMPRLSRIAKPLASDSSNHPKYLRKACQDSAS